MIKITKRIIGLITDFGQKGSHYVASMKGVILNLHRNVSIIDISHTVSPFSIIEAAYILKTVYPYYPEKSIFVIVVDPGVGSEREILALKNNLDQFFIGPNNGIFPLALSLRDIDECITVKNPKFFNSPVSQTFHGRDIMAPIAAYISTGVSLKEFGTKFDFNNFIEINLKPQFIDKDKLINCTIQYIDNFGNCTTTLTIDQDRIVNSSFSLKKGQELFLIFKEKRFSVKYFSFFNEIPENEIALLKGSTNFLEISMKRNNAANYIGLKVGDVISLRL